MTVLDRRSLLLGGLAAAALPASIARALAIPADARTGTIADIRHVVILMQENRGFDHYFGTMRGVRGFADRFPVPVAPLPSGGPRTVFTQPGADGARPVHPFHLATRDRFALMRMEGTPHSWPDAQRAWDHGRMGHWPAAKTDRSLGFYAREDLPFQFALADAFTLCDAYHCSTQTGTNTNRLFLWTGTNDPAGRAGGPAIDNSHDNFPDKGGAATSYRWTTYPERLQAAGIDWRIYQDMDDNFTDNPLAGFAAYRAARRGEPGSDPALRERALTTYGLDRLRADALSGRLPQVSWVIATAQGSEHPGPSSPAQGAAYTAAVIDALTADPAIWAKTALLVMFDENDGFFDHVPPPAPPSIGADGIAAGTSAIDTVADYHRRPSTGDAKADDPDLRGRPYGLGPRVPMYVVSPWSRGGWVNSQVFDHTSVIRFLERRFGVVEPNISAWRRAVCGDLMSAFDFAGPNGRGGVPVLPDPGAEARRAAAIVGQVAPMAPVDAPPPWQERGTRPSRALPYALDVAEVPAGDAIALTLTNRGRQAAVLHVYDRLRLDAVPRRHTVAPGGRVEDRWPLHGPDGAYDLWVLGPNGFHRHFAGRRTAAALPALDWRLAHDMVTLSIGRHDGIVLCVAPTAYANHHRPWDVPAAGGVRHWPLTATGGWYDLTIASPDLPGFVRRLAGRVENGRASTSDPALE